MCLLLHPEDQHPLLASAGTNTRVHVQTQIHIQTHRQNKSKSFKRKLNEVRKHGG